MSRIRIWILFLAASCCACAAPVRDAPAPCESEPSHTIFLVSHGWHAGIVLRRTDLPNSVWPAPEDFPDAQYLEVGWGDKDYYQTPDSHMGIILKAGLLPTASVLHIVGFNGTVLAYFPFSEIIKIELSSAGFEHLSRTIGESFARDEAGNAMSLGPGLYGNSRFYLSKEVYHLFNTCNVWTARTLHASGLPITPASTITVESLMSQARKFGIVVQAGPEPSE
ncbi:MAG: DUF2459 domain-containing protein [gamma proteobacterium endosymbiont of Lamellibrachia anaximandri]|nr:DUF2459 domain-containing protein [gamma proteobacterium endosymbiont of Lamellibrachia anaximandri]